MEIKLVTETNPGNEEQAEAAAEAVEEVVVEEAVEDGEASQEEPTAGE